MTEATLAARALRLERLVGRDPENLPGWLRQTRGEARWPAAIAILVAIALQLQLPQDLAFTPHWLLPVIELLLLGFLVVADPNRIDRERPVLRAAAIGLVIVASLATAWSAGRLVYRIVYGGGTNDAVVLLLNGGAIWLTNMIVFALWYWEGDRGGPAARANARDDYPDFMFPQMTSPHAAHRDWEPHFVDYLYLSFTNSTAFSPTDTLPMSRWAKLTMMGQSMVSLATVALVVARAINILR
ncbi:DUF1345 domain-containing protein [Planosporangium flavigriseum]|nr:DUF1345 domain-containing protein [Planosporangium flavigriseum]NJC64178.1 DUF1345 domain-containing protein [Planosporangium flavigriseum]